MIDNKVLFEISVYVFIGLIFFLVDIFTGRSEYYQECFDNKNFLFMLFLHHVISSFLLLGWMSPNFYILCLYIILVFSVFIHWKTNDNKCALTVYIKKICKTDVEFRNVFHFLSLKDFYVHFFSVFLIVSMIRIYRRCNKMSWTFF